MASNLPPGVTESMLPGNSAQDRADEALAERIWEILAPLRDRIVSNIENEHAHEGVEMAIFALVSESYAKGYDDCKSDEAIERAALRQDKEPI